MRSGAGCRYASFPARGMPSHQDALPSRVVCRHLWAACVSWSRVRAGRLPSCLPSAVLPVARTSPLPYAPAGCRKITAVKQPAAISARDGALSAPGPACRFRDAAVCEARHPAAASALRKRHRHCGASARPQGQSAPKSSPHPSPAQTFEQGQGSVLLRLRKTSMLFADGSSNASIVDAVEQPHLHATGFVRARPVASARETPAL